MFPNLASGVDVGLATALVLPSSGTARVIFVGDNGTYEVDALSSTTTQTVSVGKGRTLNDDAQHPLFLGPIREMIVAGSDARLGSLQILVIPDQNGPLDMSVTAPPSTPAAPQPPTTIDVVAHAEAEAGDAGLQLPLQLLRFTQPDLTGSHTEPSPASDPGKILFTYTPSAGQGVHPVASFEYTVEDANGTIEVGKVQVTIDTPPVITIQNEHPAFSSADGVMSVPHGTPGPLTADIYVSDADGDPVTLTLSAPAEFGQVELNQLSPGHYTYQYDPPTISAYDPSTNPTTGITTVNYSPGVGTGVSSGLTTKVTAIVGSDQFTLEAGDDLAVTDSTVAV